MQIPNWMKKKSGPGLFTWIISPVFVNGDSTGIALAALQYIPDSNAGAEFFHILRNLKLLLLGLFFFNIYYTPRADRKNSYVIMHKKRNLYVMEESQ